MDTEKEKTTTKEKRKIVVAAMVSPFVLISLVWGGFAAARAASAWSKRVNFSAELAAVVRTGDLKQVKAMLNSGVSVEPAGGKPAALSEAIYREYYGTAELLIQRGHPNITLMFLLAGEGFTLTRQTVTSKMCLWVSLLLTIAAACAMLLLLAKVGYRFYLSASYGFSPYANHVSSFDDIFMCLSVGVAAFLLHGVVEPANRTLRTIRRVSFVVFLLTLMVFLLMRKLNLISTYGEFVDHGV